MKPDPSLQTSSLTMIGRRNNSGPDDPFRLQLSGVDEPSASETVEKPSGETAAAKVHLYLAGPMRGHAASNFPAFHRVARDLRIEGYVVYSPAEMDLANGFDPELEEEEQGFDLSSALADDLEIICKDADGVALLPGWQESRGARAEVATALALDKPVRMADDWLAHDESSNIVSVFAGNYTTKPGYLARQYSVPVDTQFAAELDERIAATPEPHLVNAAFEDLTTIGQTPPEAVTFTPGTQDSIFTKGGWAESIFKLPGLPAVLPQDEEIRVTSETGGAKGDKLTKVGAYDPLALLELGRVSGYGAQKYAAYNYLKGYDWSLTFNAMMRHAFAFWAGEDNDPESGLPHMAHAMWHAGALVSFSKRELGTDDRFKP